MKKEIILKPQELKILRLEFIELTKKIERLEEENSRLEDLLELSEEDLKFYKEDKKRKLQIYDFLSEIENDENVLSKFLKMKWDIYKPIDLQEKATLINLKSALIRLGVRQKENKTYLFNGQERLCF